jgi:glyoxylase-like metal-dependent hydrolase (beta-lactamase superfamily II)
MDSAMFNTAFRLAAPHILRCCALALLGGAATALPAASALAAAPLARTQAPGYYRLQVGDFEVTALSDGTIPLNASDLLNEPAAHTDDVLAQHHQGSPVETSVNAYLVNTGKKLILIDTGAGPLMVKTTGALQASLKAAGYRPEQVDEIYLTHLHVDHVGGLMAGTRRAFPNAVVRSDRRDTEYWLSKDEMARAPEGARSFFQSAMLSLDPYVKAGRYQPFDGASELSPGFRSYPNYGHTPGHTVYGIESKGQKMLFWGDLLHVAAVQFAEPAVTIKFDSDTVAAALSRQKGFADAAADGYLVAGAHLSFPGIGRLLKNGDGYSWMPVNYALVH